MLERVVSGGQTGVDQAGWRAAKALGLATGGWMPLGFLTEDGPRPEFAELYGAEETTSTDYRVRTEKNAQSANQTIWFGTPDSPGYVATKRMCDGLCQGMRLVVPGKGVRPSDVADWIISSRVKVLNVAGSRESRAPGIGEKTEAFLITVFRLVLNRPEKPPPEVMGKGWYPEPY